MTAVETPSFSTPVDDPPRSKDPDAVRELLAQVEKTLNARRLYAAHMAPHGESFQRLAAKLDSVLADGGITLRVGRSELLLDDVTVYHRQGAEDCWFFPLYRDGVRELIFRWPPSAAELESFLTVLEADRRGLVGSSEDTVVLLWRSDLEAISYSALDGLGDEEGEDGEAGSGSGPSDELRALVQEVMSMIESPAPPVTGQRYAFHLDADVRVSATDLRYDPDSVRRAFEQGPTALPLTPGEAEALREQSRADDGAALVERFVEILIFLVTDPRGVVPVERVTQVLEQLAEGYWAVGELGELVELTKRLDEGRRSAADPLAREALDRILQALRSPDRVARALELLADGRSALGQALELWQEEEGELWLPMLDFWASLPEGELEQELKAYLRGQLVDRPELLTEALDSPTTTRVHAALALLDHRVERLFTEAILSLGDHPDPQVRLKAVAAAGRLGGQQGFELLWEAMEGDPAQAVRLLAFRSMSVCGLGSSNLEARLLGLVEDPSFRERPHWEQRKYVSLLGKVAPESARRLFESWLTSRRLGWSLRGESNHKLALAGLAQCGPGGLDRLRELAQSGGRLGRSAAATLASVREGR